MSLNFAETLKKLRTEKGLSQREVAEQIFVSRPTVARWENGSRLPDADMISRLSKCLGVDINTLLSSAGAIDEAPNVIMVDDRKIILAGGMPVLESVMPHACIAGFTRPSEAIEYARANPVALAFLDIEMGRMSGLELCQKLLDINPRTNVVYLTAYSDYAIDAWDTGASGFMLKPITADGVRNQLKKLRYPFPLGGTVK
jgi:DNA-binding NarL/FixJ family response regulator